MELLLSFLNRRDGRKERNRMNEREKRYEEEREQ
jgi:hypothetical protein